MSNPMPASKPSRKTSQRRAVIGCCAVLPLLLVIMAVWLYAYNNRRVQMSVPTPRMPDPNAYDDFVRAGKLARAMKHKSPYSMSNTAPTFADFAAAAKEAQPVLTTVRKGLDHEYLNPPVRSYRDNSFPIFASFRELARVHSGVAMYYEMDGKPAKATEARLDCLELSVMMPRGGLVIAALVAVACESIAVNQFEPQIPLLSEAELAHVAARLDRIAAKRVSFADTLQEEGYFQTSTDVELLNDPKGYKSLDTIRDLLAEEDDLTGKKKPLSLQQNWELARFLFADKSAIVRENIEYNGRLVAEARKPYYSASSVPEPNNLLAQVRGGVFSQTRKQTTAMEAVQAILRTDVALHRYKKAHGRFPKTLTDLAPTYLLRGAMSDPFSPDVLRYRPLRNGQGYLLYSVGSDQKDDSGTPTSNVANGPGDIVAGRLWPRRTLKK